MSFDGINIDMRRFFLEIGMNRSNTVWFEENRSRYEKNVRDPLRNLASELSSTMLEIDERFDTRPGRVVSRIRRDNRYTKDKSLYRDHLWLAYRPQGKKLSEGLSMYVGFTQDEVHWGMGFYYASPKEMKCIRDAIVASPTTFMDALLKDRISAGFMLEGDTYKRCPRGYEDVPDEIRPFMMLKNIGLFHAEPYSEAVYDGSIVNRIEKDFMEMKPLYTFLVRAAESAADID